jgi:transcriptional regulator with XRE-family HTH domain
VIVTRQVEIRKRAPLTPERFYRVKRGVTLTDAARLSGLSTYRISIIERSPEKGRPGELETLRAAVDRAAREARP